MQTDFLVLTDEELLAVHGGKGRVNCLPKFLKGMARGAVYGIPLGAAGIVGGANLGMVGGALSCL